jgi:hypothetical protein
MELGMALVVLKFCIHFFLRSIANIMYLYCSIGSKIVFLMYLGIETGTDPMKNSTKKGLLRLKIQPYLFVLLEALNILSENRGITHIESYLGKSGRLSQ